MVLQAPNKICRIANFLITNCFYMFFMPKFS
ncbi:hypothetical protein X474_03455 [Dethiosulfatarculus sandiegensis]|uniref:Uncharacterized protein n=1 Tax=Dethiosulfatarculus sandiegensis TaxID=1429043 RepID=A0A0D2K110_9BACT|nr:hypothetical protein X474_03455 [Dethiosulfatarculus sandiegensis]